jgi:hypothetical protein
MNARMSRIHRGLLVANLKLSTRFRFGRGEAKQPRSGSGTREFGLRLCLAFCLVAAVPGAAAAQSVQPVARAQFLTVMDQEFRKIDADKDGKLVKAEVEAFQRAVAVAESAQRNRALFAQLDSDRNGQINQAEFVKLAVTPPSPDAGPLLAQSDLNKDQHVTLVEYRTAKLANFDRMDADKDGVVSVAEMRAGGLVK